ncbi:MAG TPA: methyltransferase domain-containing protein [Chloroflexota bacterium]|nr:methyltransferase domain-containing protein [Chloroflexota bacterium]
MNDTRPEAPRPPLEVIDDGGRPALAIDGTVQSVAVGSGAAPSGYWPAMLPDRAPREALLLGLGGGTIAHLLVGTHGALPIVGVDDDPAVVALGRARFGLDLPNLEIVVADAFAYAAACPRRFDFVCVDLFRDGRIPARVCASAFLTSVRRLLRPGGLATFNLARDRRAGDRLRQLERHFLVVRRILVGFNLVVHCALTPATPASETSSEGHAGAARPRRARPARGRRRGP